MDCFCDHGAPPSVVVPSRYNDLHDDGKRLIAGWLQRAWKAHGQHLEEPFEPFIFAWIAFNAWGACVTGEERDHEMIQALAWDRELGCEFSRLLNTNRKFRAAAESFHEVWPVFNASDLRGRGLAGWGEGKQRQEVVRCYLGQGVTKYEPKCWEKHSVEPCGAPVDWLHTLPTLYRVRNNLFHGEKARHLETDRLIVSRALPVLLTFLKEADIGVDWGMRSLTKQS